MRRLRILIITLCLLGANVSTVSAQEVEDYKYHKGYVDFSDFEGLNKIEKTVEVFLEGPILKFVSMASAGEDPELSQLLEDLKVIKVDVFQVERRLTEEVKSIIDNISSKLKSENWTRMVRVKEEDEQVEIFTQFTGNVMSGILVMAIDKDGEAVFVNIVGKIDPSQLGKLGGKFNIPNLDSIEIEDEK